MNIENSKKAVEVMNAFISGKAIQHKSKCYRDDGHWETDTSNKWYRCHDPDWNWDEYEYRVKAKKRIIWRLSDKHGNFMANGSFNEDSTFEDREKAIRDADISLPSDAPHRFIQFKEVIGE